MLIGFISLARLNSGRSPNSTASRAHERRHDQRRDQHEVVDLQVDQQLRHQDRGEQEDQRMRPERHLRPDAGEVRPSCAGRCACARSALTVMPAASVATTPET